MSDRKCLLYVPYFGAEPVEMYYSLKDEQIYYCDEPVGKLSYKSIKDVFDDVKGDEYDIFYQLYHFWSVHPEYQCYMGLWEYTSAAFSSHLKTINMDAMVINYRSMSHVSYDYIDNVEVSLGNSITLEDSKPKALLAHRLHYLSESWRHTFGVEYNDKLMVGVMVGNKCLEPVFVKCGCDISNVQLPDNYEECYKKFMANSEIGGAYQEADSNRIVYFDKKGELL